MLGLSPFALSHTPISEKHLCLLALRNFVPGGNCEKGEIFIKIANCAAVPYVPMRPGV